MKLNWTIHRTESFTVRFILTNPAGQPYVPETFGVLLAGSLKPFRLLPAEEQFTVTRVPNTLNQYDVSLTPDQTDATGSRHSLTGFAVLVSVDGIRIIEGIATYKYLTGSQSIQQQLNVPDIGGQTITVQIKTVPGETPGGGENVLTSGLFVQVQSPVALSSGRLIANVTSGLEYYDVTRSSHLYSLFGVSANAAGPGDPLKLQVAGELTIPGWGLVPGRHYFAGLNGLLTLIQPNNAFFSQVVGKAVSSDSFMFSPQTVYQWQRM